MAMDLTRQLERYAPFNRQEEADRSRILAWLRTEENVFSRKNQAAHMTASAWVVNPERTRVLLAYHNLYDSWAWLGGHADGQRDLLAVALREAGEESALKRLRPVREDIFSLEVLAVNGHVKRGKYISSHLHLNLTYLIEGREDEKPAAKEDENRAVAWFGLQEAVTVSKEAWFAQTIYAKLNEKLKKEQL